MALKVELQNIGGLRGDHSFSFGDGLNVLKAPNATGKSSLLNGIFLIAGNKHIDEAELQRFLTDNEVSGFVRLTDDQGRKSEVRLTRDLKKGVSISKMDVQEPFTSDTGVFASFLREQSQINQGIQAANDHEIENWFNTVTKVNDWLQAYTKAESIFNELEGDLDDLKEKHGQDVENIKDLIKKKQSEIEALVKRKEEINADPTLQKNKRRIDEIGVELKPLEKELKEVLSLFADINSEIASIVQSITQKGKDIDSLDKELKNIQNLRAKLLSQKDRAEKIIKEKTAAVADLRAKEGGIHEKSRSLYEVIQKLRGLKGRSECPTCGHELNREETERNLKETETQYEKSQQDELKISREKDAAERERRNATAELMEIEVLIKKRPEDVKDPLDAAIKEKNNLEKRRKSKDQEKAEAQGKVESLKADIEKLEEERRGCYAPQITKELKDIDSKRSDLERDIQAQENKLEEFEADDLELPKAEKRVALASSIKDHFRAKYDRVKKDLVKRINDRLKQSFELLKLAELERITIEPERFKIDIQRADKSYTTLQKMCGAERALISLIISFAVKSTLWDEAPIFMIDEVTNEMDDGRFKSAINLIAKEIPYLVVARHSPFTGTKKAFTGSDIAHSL